MDGWFICFAQYFCQYSIEKLGYTDDLNQNITVEGKKKRQNAGVISLKQACPLELLIAFRRVMAKSSEGQLGLLAHDLSLSLKAAV